MIYILTSTSTILRVEARSQESRIGDSNVTSVLSLKLKSLLSKASFTEQKNYLQSSAIAAYTALNKLDQRARFRININFIACNGHSFNFTQGSSSSGLGYAMACFDTWWRVNLKKGSSFKLPIFTTGEVSTSGQINSITQIAEKIESLCEYVVKNKASIPSFYFCYPRDNDDEISKRQKERVLALGGVLVPSTSLQHTLGELLNTDYDGDPLGRWLPFKGLDSFGYEDSIRFFGRNKDIARLCLDIEHNEGLFILSGAGGVGKSSLIKAGVIPKLERENESFYWAVCTPNNLIKSQSILNFITEELITAFSIQPVNAEKIKQSFAISPEDGIKSLKQCITDKEPMCLFYVDQYEEAINQEDKNIDSLISELAIINSLSNTLASVNIILCIKSEYLDLILNNPVTDNISISNLESRLTAKEWHSIVYEQACFSGISFEPGQNDLESLDSVIVEEALKTPSCLPMVNLLLSQLYIKLKEEDCSSVQLSHQHYLELGGLSGCIAYVASKIIEEDNVSEILTEKLFHCFVGITHEGLAFSVPVSLSEIEEKDEELSKLVRKFMDRGIIVGKNTEVFFVNNSIFDEWVLIKRWFVKNKKYLIWKRGINDKFTNWKNARKIKIEKNLSVGNPLEEIREGVNEFFDIYNKRVELAKFEIKSFRDMSIGMSAIVQEPCIDPELVSYIRWSMLSRALFLSGVGIIFLYFWF